MPGSCPGWGAFQSALGGIGGDAGGMAAGGGGGGRGSSAPNSRGLSDPSPHQNDPGMTPAQWFSAQPDDYRFANMDSRPESDPGKAWAEDGTQVGNDYWG